MVIAYRLAGLAALVTSIYFHDQTGLALLILGNLWLCTASVMEAIKEKQ